MRMAPVCRLRICSARVHRLPVRQTRSRWVRGLQPPPFHSAGTNYRANVDLAPRGTHRDRRLRGAASPARLRLPYRHNARNSVAPLASPGACSTARAGPGRAGPSAVPYYWRRTRSASAHRAVATPTVPRGGQRAEAPAAFRILCGSGQPRHPGSAPVGDLDPDDAVPGNDRDRLPGAPDRLCRTLLLKISLTSKRAASRQGCPEPSTSEKNERAARARSARLASVTLSLTASPAITRTRPSRPPRPGKPAGQPADAGTCTLTSAANVKPAQRARRGPSSVARPWSRPPSAAVRETADGAHRPSWRAPCPSAMCPWTPQHPALQQYKVTHHGTEQKRPA
jgi:hypothetical protein